jgi:glycosyltransferase involved in cell wall biosynthesis
MKIAYIASRYPAVSHTFILREVVGLRQRGFDVRTYTVRRVPGDELLTETDRDEAQRTKAILPAGVLAVLAAHLAMFFSHPLRYGKAFWQALRERPPGLRSAVWQLFYFLEAGLLARSLRRENVRHIHAHFANVAANVAMLASMMTGGTWSVTLHGLSDFGDPTQSQLRGKVASALFVVCVCDYGCGQAKLNSDSADWHKIRRVHCGIDTSVYAPLRAADIPWGADAEAPQRPLRLLSVARLGPEKAHAVLLAAARELVDQGIEVSLTCVGDGPLREQLGSLAKELRLDGAVTFTGSIGQDELPSYYDRADVFVLSSIAEGLPVVLMEAMAKGVPVVATSIAGIPELVEHNVSGLLVPVGDPHRLASALARLARDPPLRASLSSAALARVQSDFDLSKTVDALAEVFREEL